MKKIMLVIGITLMCFGILFLLIVPIVGIILILLSIGAIFKEINSKESIRKKDISALLFISLACKLNSCKKEFLVILKKESNYKELNRLYEGLDYCIERYVRNFGTLNFTPKRPINPYVAAGIGSSIAGTTGAIISYNDAYDVNEKYKQELESVNQNHIEYNQSLTDFEKCFYGIENILLNNDKTREKWLSIKEDTLLEETEKLKLKYNF